jgi:hypothetical protein
VFAGKKKSAQIREILISEVSLGRNDLLIRTFPRQISHTHHFLIKEGFVE